jgi:hypothetical protein
MPPKSLIGILFVAALPFVVAAPSAAQNDTSPIVRPGTASPAPRHIRGRITIHPGRLLYRRCVDWYELQNRSSGPVLFPEMRCWWVRG